MPNLSEHEKSRFVKLLLIGNSGAGKTGALAPLVRDGYSLRIYDFDAGLDALVFHCKEAKLDLSKIEYMSFRDQVKMTPTGTKLKGSPRAYPGALAALDQWEDGSNPAEWGEDTVVVIDSLTNVGRAAFWWAKHTAPMVKDPRQWYKTAQDLVEDLIANLTSEDFHAHVIVISHVDIGETSEGLRKHFVSSIGKALGPKLPRFFNTMLLSEVKAKKDGAVRTIHTVPTNMLDLKNPAPTQISESYPMAEALSEIFKVLRA